MFLLKNEKANIYSKEKVVITINDSNKSIGWIVKA